jgi:chromosomal replication initiator protein
MGRIMEPLDARTIARLEISHRVVPVKPISTPGPKISPPVAKAPPAAPVAQPTVQAVLVAVCEAWDITPHDLMSRWRPKRLSYPRFACVRFMRKLTDLSYPQIARALGMKDHTSTMHAMRRSNDLLHEDSAWRACYLRALANMETQGRGATAGDGAGTEPRTLPAPAVAKPLETRK